MKLAAVLATAVLLAACGDANFPTQVQVEDPSPNRLTNDGTVGTWVGTEEITTDEDIASNQNFPGTNGYMFPVVVQLDGSGRFTLITSNYPTSYTNDADRSCTGVYSHANASIQFYSTTSCRALPMTKYVIGRDLSGRLTFEARTNTSTPTYVFTSIHVIFNLSKQ